MVLEKIPERLQGPCHMGPDGITGDPKLFCDLFLSKALIAGKLVHHPLLIRKVVDGLLYEEAGFFLQ